MKKILVFLAAVSMVASQKVDAQDAALMERLGKLSGLIDDLIAAKDVQNKKIDELAKAVDALQQQQSKPNASYATQDDLKGVRESLKEIDRKQQKDNEHILKELDNLSKTLRTPPPKATAGGATDNAGSGAKMPDTTGVNPQPHPEKGFEYVVKENDTISAIAKAYNDQGIKVTIKQILDANPKVKPETLKVGQKIFIPAPAQ